MHIPDGFIDTKTAVAAASLSVAGVGLALRQVRRDLPPRRVPLLGLAAAFLFAAQMINFPVAGGTSGHLIGGALVAVLLGPAAGVVVVASVLIVQCFLFADGGVLALGANIFNMGIVATVTGYGVARAVRAFLPGQRGQVAAMAFAGWCSAVIASVGCAAQLAWSGTVPWGVALPAMVGVHMLIGIGEGLISALVLLAVLRTRPDLVLQDGQGPAASVRGLVGYGLVVALGLALFVAPFACPWPDGLEAVAARLGFGHRALSQLLPAPAPDYLAPGVRSRVLATAIAGAAGALVAFGLALGLSRFLVRERPVMEEAGTP
jgi:cobalt/nickel transport system permease protein